MRDVTLPSSAALLAGIARPERFRPEPRLVKPLEWRRLDDGFGEVRSASGVWERVHPIYAEAIAALHEGASLDAICARAAPKLPEAKPVHADSLVRSYLWKLHEAGHVEIPFEPFPDVFEGRYERVRELGRGGLGVVHLCRDRKTDRLVAIKHAWGWTKSIEKAEKEVRREAQVLAAFDHVAIPKLLDTFELGGQLHMVRELVEGDPLQKLVTTGATRDRARRVAIARSLAGALLHIHDRGWLFLDAKPGNFMVEGREARILDLGLCKPHEGGTLTLRGAIGSPGYASPEVVWKHQASLRSDVFGLGRVLAAMSLGRRPKRSWTAAEIDELLAQAGVHEDERALAARMCAEDPEDRPADMREVLAALEALA